MKKKHQRTLEQIFTRPTSGNIKWSRIEVRELVSIYLNRPKYFIDHTLLQTQTKALLPAFVNG